MTEQIQKLTETAVKAIKDKKGKGISVIDMQGMDGVICQAFVICQGGSPSQISAIADNVEEVMRKELGEKPLKIAGMENCYWVAMAHLTSSYISSFQRHTTSMTSSHYGKMRK